MKFFVSLFTFTLSALFASEPAIIGFYLPHELTIKSNELMVHEKLALASTLTTPSGRMRFKLTPRGVEVTKPGLYRINYYQVVYSEAQTSSLRATLRRMTPTSYSDRRKHHCYISYLDARDIAFSQIVRLNAKDAIQIIIQPLSGKMILPNGMNLSGLTIEAL